MTPVCHVYIYVYNIYVYMYIYIYHKNNKVADKTCVACTELKYTRQ